MKIENIYTLALAYSVAKKQHDYYEKTNSPYKKLYKNIVKSFEHRFINLNEDIDVMSFFGDQNALEDSNVW